MRKTRTLLVLASILTLVVASPVDAARPSTIESAAPDVYIVVLRGAPVVAYDGEVAGIPATAPKNGEKINPNSAKVKKYVAYLDAQHAALLARAGASSDAKFYDYRYSLNGFAAVLTPAQAGKLSAMPEVLLVERDQLHEKTTENSPNFLGLTNPSGGLWEDLGLTGEDVIVGVIDTGIWPEHPSFSDQADLADRPGESGKRTRVYDAPTGWFGTCQSGELWSQDDCNNKLIGARYFLTGFGKHGIVFHDYKSARDADGHGTHTSSTAAGNAGVQASIFGEDFGTMSGMAPRARVAMYKACWNDAGCFGSDLAAAIDAAVADGVDVINYSIGSDSPGFTGSDDIAFLFAAFAGVFVANSAGNAGPSAGTIGSPAAAPWLTTVGASTQDRTFEATVTLGNAASYDGASVTEATDGSFEIIDAADAGSELCFVGELNPAVVSGKIVLCKRGTNARVDKSLAVQVAGGVGMVLYNAVPGQALLTDNHWLPSVHISYADGLAVLAYIDANPGTANASISAGAAVAATGSVMADFSSRGPNLAAQDIIKPDVTAPGVNILAGNTPTPFSGRPGELFQSISGTSMSSPHVAGIAALLKGQYPSWGLEEIKSALMTTGRQNVVDEDGVTPSNPFDFGGGHIVPNSAVDPGLVFEADDPAVPGDQNRRGYLAFLCGAAPAIIAPATCTTLAGLGHSFDASDLNLASIGVASLVGSETTTRTVRGISAGTWTASYTGLAGYSVTLPAPFALGVGAYKTFDITFTNTGAPIGTWVFGEVTFTDGGAHTVQVPVALRAQSIDAPARVEDTSAASDTTTWNVKVGYTGTLAATGYGLVADTVTGGLVVAQDPDQDPTTDTLTSGMYVRNFTLSGAQYLAGGTREVTTEAGSDLDIYLLFDDDGTAGCSFNDSLVAFSADGDSEEIVEVVHPADGDYCLLVHGWGTPDGASSFSLHEWVVNDTTPEAADFNVHAGAGDPAAVSTGDTVLITASYSGLSTTGTQYRGVVDYTDGVTTLASTVLYINR